MRFRVSLAFIRVLQAMSVSGWLLAFGLSAAAADDLSSRLVWTVQLGGGGDVQPNQLVTDLTGNTYVCGGFSGTLLIGTNRFTSAGDNDAFLLKFDTTGRLVWARTFGSAGFDSAIGVSLSPEGGVVIAGKFSNAINIGAQTLTALGPTDWFVAKFTNDGALIWAKQGGSTYASASSVFVDADQNVFVGLVNSQAQQQLLKLSGSGLILWQINTPANHAFGADSTGVVYALDSNGAVAKLDRSGVTQAIFSLGTTAVGYDGCVLNGIVAVGGQLQARPRQSFLRLMQPTGAVIATAIGFDIDAALTGVSLVESGAVAAGHDSQFFFKVFDNGGTLVQTLRWGNYLDSGLGVGIDQSGFTYMVCRFVGQFSVGSTNLVADSGTDAAILKFVSGAVGAISQQPQSHVAALGEDTTLSVRFFSGTPTTFQWRHTGTNLPGANASTLTLTNVQMSNAGSYDVVIQSGGKTVTSASATLTVDPPPSVSITNPQQGDRITQSNSGTSFNVDVDAQDDGRVSLVTLYLDNELFGHATTPPYTFSVFVNTDGPHVVQASATDNLGITRFGSNVVVNIGHAPSLTPSLILDSTNFFGFEGTGITLTVEAGGTLPINFQWFKDGGVIPGQTARRLVFNRLAPSDAGDYTLRATNVFGTAFTSAHLTVDPSPIVAIISPPNGAVIERGSNIVVSVRAEDDGSVTNVTLLADGAAVGSRTAGPYTFTVRFDDEDNHILRARATDNFGAVAISDPLTVRVGHRPTEVRASPGLTVPTGVNVALSAHFDGTAPMFYHWLKGEDPLFSATASTLVLTNVVIADSGNYALRATNLFGVQVTEPVLLTVTNAVGEFIQISVGGRTLAATATNVSFTDAAVIALDSIFGDGLIFFTLDGSAPDFAGRIFTGPFMIRNTAVLRAVTYNGDLSAWAERPAITLLRAESSYTLQTSVSGGGGISRDVPTVDDQYASNAIVRLTATATDGWSFIGWSGDSLDAAPQMDVTMNRSKSLRANFGTPLTLRVSGSGDVIANPTVNLYPYGARVRLAAIPEPGNYFAVWGGAAAGLTNNPLELQITNARPVVSALFAPLAAGQVALSVRETGEGAVTVQPAGNRFTQGTVVTLNAVAKGGQSFLGWSGDAAGTNNPLSVTLTNSKAITAQFTANQFLSIRRSSLRDARSVTLHVQAALGAPFRMDASVDLRNWNSFLQTNALGTFDYSEAMTNGAVRFFELR